MTRRLDRKHVGPIVASSSTVAYVECTCGWYAPDVRSPDGVLSPAAEARRLWRQHEYEARTQESPQ